MGQTTFVPWSLYNQSLKQRISLIGRLSQIYLPFNFMTLSDFTALISSVSDPVILIEGRRSITEDAADEAKRLALLLAQRFPRLRFRSGNAMGSDEAFSAGVIDIAPDRLQVITPYEGHRKKQRHPLVGYFSPESLDEAALTSAISATNAATPANQGLMKCYGRSGRAGAQAACLIRDTLKVIGFPGHLTPPTAALFWIDPKKPEAGGTGHTIRVCRNAGIPTVFQYSWVAWLNELQPQP